MIYIIIKTYKTLQSELISIHGTKEEASHHLNNLIDEKLINRIHQRSEALNLGFKSIFFRKEFFLKE